MEMMEAPLLAGAAVALVIADVINVASGSGWLIPAPSTLKQQERKKTSSS